MFITSKDEIRAFLLKAYAEFRQQGRVIYHGNQGAIEPYSHREMARKFALAMDETLEKKVSGLKANSPSHDRGTAVNREESRSEQWDRADQNA